MAHDGTHTNTLRVKLQQDTDRQEVNSIWVEIEVSDGVFLNDTFDVLPQLRFLSNSSLESIQLFAEQLLKVIELAKNNDLSKPCTALELRIDKVIEEDTE